MIQLILIFLLASFANATDYYLDCDLATGNDNGGLTDTWDNAWQAIDSVVWGSGGVSDGDTLYLSGDADGTTCTTTTGITPDTGSEGAIVTMMVSQESGHNGEVYIDGGDSVTKLINLTDYLTIDGEVSGERKLTFQNWGAVGVGNGNEGYAIYGNGDDHVTLKYIDVINDDYLCSGDCTAIEWKNCAYLLYANDVLIDHMYFEGCVENSLVMGATHTASGYDDNTIQYTTIQSYFDDSGRGGADGLKTLGGTTVKYNQILYEQKTDVWYNPSHTAEDGIQIQDDWIKVYGNIIQNAPASALRTDQVPANLGRDNILIYNNLFYLDDTTPSLPRGIQIDTSGYAVTNMKIYGNTIVGMKHIGIDVNIADEADVDIEVKNNLFVDCTKEIRVYAAAATSTAGVVVDYNLALETNLTTQGAMTRETDPTEVTLVQTNEPYDSSETMAFVTYVQHSASNDYALHSTADMAIGAGVDLGSPYDYDIEGTERGSVFDIGAYEYEAGAPDNLGGGWTLSGGTIQ